MNQSPANVPMKAINQQNQAEESSGGNPLLAVHRRLRGKYRYAIPTGLILGLCAAAFTYKSISNEYESVGMMEITPTSQRVLYATEQNQAMPMFDAWVNAQIGLMNSPRVIDLALKNERWLEKGGHSDRGTFQDGLEIWRSRGSLLINVAYSSENRVQAQAAAQALMEAYREVHLDQSNRGQVWTVEALQSLLSELALQRKELRNQVIEITGPLTPTALQGLYDAKFEEQMGLESMLMAARLELAAIESALSPDGAPRNNEEEDDEEDPGPPDPLSSEELAAADEMLRNLLQTRGERVLILEEMVLRYGEAHRESRRVSQSIDMINRQINRRVEDLNGLILKQWSEEGSEAGAIALSSGLPGGLNNLDTVKSRITSLTELREEVKVQAGNLNSDLARIEEIKEHDAALARRVTDAESRLAALEIERENTGRVRIVNEGEMPFTPSNRKKRMQMAAGAGAGGFAMPFALAFLVGLLRGRLTHFDDAKASLGGNAFLGILPQLPEDIADPQQALVASLSVHEIRSLLHSVSENYNAKSFMITSATAGAGKTSLVLALGLSYAGAGNKTLLIDFDTIGTGLSTRIRRIVRGRLGQVLIEQGMLEESQLIEAIETSERNSAKLGQTLVELGYVNEGQLTESLNRQSNQSQGLREAVVSGDLQSYVTETGIPNLDALPVGETSVGDVGTFAKNDLRALLEKARENYDMVLIDTGPILGSLEAAMVAKEADATIMVLAAGEKERTVNQAIERLQHNNASLAGLIFNRAMQKDVVNLSSSASQRSRVSQAADPTLLHPHNDGKVAEDYGPIAQATAAFQRKHGE